MRNLVFQTERFFFLKFVASKIWYLKTEKVHDDRNNESSDFYFDLGQCWF